MKVLQQSFFVFCVGFPLCFRYIMRTEQCKTSLKALACNGFRVVQHTLSINFSPRDGVICFKSFFDKQI